ncbi:pectin lyase fold/virulence factor [Podospora aff. communis PSN243]|uniref:Pectin lyase fold/virulence factor n=1 Tax=Podospora aff. communis PSN243 TaxID=3040156 RepID=A0AAV9GDX0_9PEZI|nr:pectin lyase fold/virulence factor [Podospora aff. communis PSN243]
MRSSLIALLGVATLATAQLSGRVGPTTTREAKAAKKVCNILDFGGVASATTDNSDAITKAWDACKAGGQVLIPSGSFGLEKWVDLTGGSGVAINVEGIIFRISSGTASGTMISVQSTDDFEFYSANSKGAVQGYGYEFHKDNKYGPRILRLTKVTNFSVHDVALVDSPAFHLTIDSSSNGEVYNLIIHGGDRGGLDGVGLWGTNIHVHDVEVSNRDECVTVKSPSRDILVESIFCNLSGGCAIGSLGTDTNITRVTYQNIYTHHSNQMLMIKSNGGNGFFNDALFTNFTGHSNAYTLNLDSSWAQKEPDPGDGVEYDRITFSNWAGTCLDGTRRAPIQLFCPESLLCGNMEVSNFNVWTQNGSEVLYKCQNAYGIGACMNQFAGNGAYTSTMTVKTMDPTSYAVPTMPGEITKGLGITTQIAIPPVPTTFYPGLKPKSGLMAQPTG